MTGIAGFLPRSERNATTFDNTFQTLGTASASPIIQFKIVNNSDTLIDVSVDAGTTEHDVVPAGNFVLYDVRSNRGTNEKFAFRSSTQFHIRGAAAGVGIVYLTVLREEPR